MQPLDRASVPFTLISREELKSLSWDQGRTDAQIAHMFGVTANQVNQKRRLMNLVQGAVTAEQHSNIVRLAESVKSLPMAAIEEIQAIVSRYQG